MRTIEVSDEIYEAVAKAAAERSITLDRYIVETIETQNPVRFSAEQFSAMDQGVEDIRNGRVSGWDEVESWIDERRSERENRVVS